MYDCLLFDFDGVLFDSEPLHYQCWRDLMAVHGLQLTWELYQATGLGVSDFNMIRTLCGLWRRADLIETIWRDYPRKKLLFRERLLAVVPIPPSTRELLQELQSYGLAVVTSSDREEVEPALVAAGIREVFSAVVTGDEVGQLKPSPEPYLKAADQLKGNHPLVIEDSEAGVQSGLAAGFDVLFIPEVSETSSIVRSYLWGRLDRQR
jgi:HAD superfamily hydrolase (TIGR01509 family)